MIGPLDVIPAPGARARGREWSNRRRIGQAAAVLLGTALGFVVQACSGASDLPSAGLEVAVTAEAEGHNVPAAVDPQVVPGVSATRILFGQSAAFSGPAQELGRSMRLGIQAAFHEVNQRGGVHGRRLELSSRDDAYEPEAAIANTFALIEEDQVFALIGAVGTPTSRSATPIAAAAGVPYIAPFTGAPSCATTHCATCSTCAPPTIRRLKRWSPG